MWNMFLTSKTCSPEGDAADSNEIFLDCNARGWSCWCISGLQSVQQHDRHELPEHHEDFRLIVISIEGAITASRPVPIAPPLEDHLSAFPASSGSNSTIGMSYSSNMKISDRLTRSDDRVVSWLNGYARGGSCWCSSGLHQDQQHDRNELLEQHEDCRLIVIIIE